MSSQILRIRDLFDFDASQRERLPGVLSENRATTQNLHAQLI